MASSFPEETTEEDRVTVDPRRVWPHVEAPLRFEGRAVHVPAIFVPFHYDSFKSEMTPPLATSVIIDSFQCRFPEARQKGLAERGDSRVRPVDGYLLARASFHRGRRPA